MWKPQIAHTTTTNSTFQSPNQGFLGGQHCETPLPPPPPPIAPVSMGLGGAESPYLLPPPPPPTTGPPTVAPGSSNMTSVPVLSTFQPVQPPPPPPPPPQLTSLPSSTSAGISGFSYANTSSTTLALNGAFRPTLSTTSEAGPAMGVATTTSAGLSPGGASVTSGAGGSSSTHSGPREAVLCQICGQFHDLQSSHLYDYSESIDADLLCKICQQPLLDPLDTKCGHTFCTPCLKNHLAVQALCPVDKQIINYLECQQASPIVKRLLDKLLVVCPNVDYCEEVLPRCELEAHLLYMCRGAVTRCPRAHLGCTYQGPRSAHAAHKWECAYRSEANGDEAGSGGNGVNGAVGGAVGGENAYSTGEKPPVIEGEVTTIEIARGGHCDLGLSFVGGCDTPLMCVIIQEIYLDGIVTKDGRLRPGDQILEVNGEDLTQATHAQAKRALSVLNNVCRMTVYRERAEESNPIEKEEIIKISLSKRNDKKLGIKLVGKKNRPGLYVLGLVKGAEADLDGRLQKDDRILEINGADLRDGTQDDAAEIICSATDRVVFLVARISRPQTPDIIRTASGENITDCAGGLTETTASEGRRKGSLSRVGIREQVVTVCKAAGDSLGMSVAGGLNSQRGDTPIYVTNVTPDGVLGRTRRVKKGDILLAVNDTELVCLSHERAVEALKCASIDSRQVTLRLLEGPETSSGGGNFMPSWVYWLQLPRFCQIPRTIMLPRDPSGSLGFSIVGGNDCCIQMSPGGLGSSPLPQPIVVKSIVPGTPAHRDGRLKCGDILISVNGINLTDISHAHAVTVLKHVRGDVKLFVVSWPGTIV